MSKKILFISGWQNIKLHHVTQIGVALNAEILYDYDFLQKVYDNPTENLRDIECIITVPKFIHSPKDVQSLGLIIEKAKKHNCDTKFVMFEMEGLYYYEMIHLAEHNVEADKYLSWWAWILENIDLYITTNRDAVDIARLFVKNYEPQLFGFIPEDNILYNLAIKNADKRNSKYLYVGIGSKVGPSRGGAIDVLAAYYLSKQINKEVILVPLTGGVELDYYTWWGKTCGLRVEKQQQRDYYQFLKLLAGLDVVFNIDPLCGASRLASECARVRVPCVGQKRSLYHQKYFPTLCVDRPSPILAARKYLENPDAADEAYTLSHEDNRSAHIERLRTMLRDIGVKNV